MKQSTIFSSALFALLVSTAFVDASNLANEDVDLNKPLTTTPAALAEVVANTVSEDDIIANPVTATLDTSGDDIIIYDPRDRNKDGKVSFFEKLHDKLDFDRDGQLGFGDVLAAIGVTDTDGDGDIDLKDLGLVIFKALDTDGDGKLTLSDASGYFDLVKNGLSSLRNAIDMVQDMLPQLDPILALLPEQISGPIRTLIGFVGDTAETLEQGSFAAANYIDTLEARLDDILGHLKEMKKQLTAGEIKSLEQELVKGLEVARKIGGSSSINEKINTIYSKLSKMKIKKA